MKVFRKINLIFATLLLCFGCAITFAQENNSTQQKKKADSNKNQKNVFDASTATLEETQNWLKKTLAKYGRYTTRFASSFGNVDTYVSSIDDIKFKGCEMSYKRKSSRDLLGSTYSLDKDSILTRGSNAAFDTRNNPTNSYALVGKTKLNLTLIDTTTIYVSDIKDRNDMKDKKNLSAGLKDNKLFYVNFSSLANSDKDAIQTEASSFGTTLESYADKTNMTSFVVTDKEIANQVKTALMRLITLCQ